MPFVYAGDTVIGGVLMLVQRTEYLNKLIALRDKQLKKSSPVSGAAASPPCWSSIRIGWSSTAWKSGKSALLTLRTSTTRSWLIIKSSTLIWKSGWHLVIYALRDLFIRFFGKEVEALRAFFIEGGLANAESQNHPIVRKIEPRRWITRWIELHK